MDTKSMEICKVTGSVKGCYLLKADDNRIWGILGRTTDSGPVYDLTVSDLHRYGDRETRLVRKNISLLEALEEALSNGLR